MHPRLHNAVHTQQILKRLKTYSSTTSINKTFPNTSSTNNCSLTGFAPGSTFLLLICSAPLCMYLPTDDTSCS
ncbi:unnamed protein product [Periconia digitata]|uniref:Uncharacterized protein n=1 Tax=Periconia digitata TaxID=1303443 RepID=A0A9W4XSH7_9PLEO|nr:unnamed protein product [Periconia digitata]